jgi:methylated-DNA-[protein]-cysteine S-methyltransferase
MPVISIVTQYGDVKAVLSEKGVCSISFPRSKKKSRPKLQQERTEPDKNLKKRFVSEIKQYFKGGKPVSNLPLDLGLCTPFQKKVYRAAQKIGYGEVRTYGWVAKKIGNPKASRAVGQALNKNPVPIIIPCHRVVAKDGDLRGFASGLGWKKRLLKLEGVTVDKNRTKDSCS